MSINKVAILRHGESEFNKRNLFCGWHDAVLSEKGIDDAANIAAAGLRSKNMKFDIIYTSLLERANQTVNIIVNELGYTNTPIIKDWRLNERHYGNLTGYNKREMAKIHGEEKVQIWRRSFDGLPPPINDTNKYYEGIIKNENFKHIPVEELPLTESLKTLMQRTIPFWENEIKPKILRGQKVLIVAHGSVVRSLMKHIECISDEDIMNLNIPNSIPCVYQFNTETGLLVGEVDYLADENYVQTERAKVAAIGS